MKFLKNLFSVVIISFLLVFPFGSFADNYFTVEEQQVTNNDHRTTAVFVKITVPAQGMVPVDGELPPVQVERLLNLKLLSNLNDENNLTLIQEEEKPVEGVHLLVLHGSPDDIPTDLPNPDTLDMNAQRTFYVYILNMDPDKKYALQFFVNETGSPLETRYWNVDSSDSDTITITSAYDSANRYDPKCIENPGEYCLLEQLPGFPERINKDFSLGSYLNRLFQLAIALAGVLGVVMLVVAGVTYMTTDSFTGKSEGKGMAMNAIGGVVLALLSWIILNTLNPYLLDFNLKVKDLAVNPGSFGENIAYNTDGTVAGCKANNGAPDDALRANPQCQNCADLSTIVTVASTGKFVVSALKDKIESFKNLVIADNANSFTWRVTEAWKPTDGVLHCNKCHYEGTCIDANFVGSPDVNKIKAFIKHAATAKLDAQYEVKTAADASNIINSPDNSDNYLTNANVKSYSHITAPHFSVYNN